MESLVTPEIEADKSRHDAILEAAIGVFARYGFRKTSMDEVARAAGVSRQGLYLLFDDKEELFRKALTYKLATQLSAAISALSGGDADADVGALETRLVAGCDEWAGRYIGMLGADAADLMCAGTALAGNTLIHYETQFENALTHAIADSPLAAVCAAAGISAADAARALHATVRGLKQTAKTRQDFVLGVTAAARLFCAALRSHSGKQD
jgi:AcrR family transcriptional regulator